jgi:IS605 OrfB family transposase
MADVNHCISKQIVAFALKHRAPMIALEGLTNIRERIKGHKGKQNYQMHSWAFGQLQNFINYKAWGKGILVETVEPAYTSQMCSRCGHVLKSQRKGLNFRCESCGYTLQADLNAARNIEARLRLSRHTLEGPGCLSTSPEVADVDAKAHPERKRRNRELRWSLAASS